MGEVHVDDMTVEILCIDLLDFKAKSVWSSVKKMCISESVLMVALEGAHVGAPCCDLAHMKCVCKAWNA